MLYTVRMWIAEKVFPEVFEDYEEVASRNERLWVSVQWGDNRIEELKHEREEVMLFIDGLLREFSKAVEENENLSHAFQHALVVLDGHLKAYREVIEENRILKRRLPVTQRRGREGRM